MQIASRQIVWNEGGRGTVVEVEMTPATGLYIRFMCNAAEGRPVMVSWGDGSKSEHVFTTHDISSDHRYAAYGRYRIVFEGARSIGLRNLDGEAQYSYDAAIVSYVDYSGLITGSRSGAFKRSINLERFIAPNLTGFGQRDFAYCTKLREVVTPWPIISTTARSRAAARSRGSSLSAGRCGATCSWAARSSARYASAAWTSSRRNASRTAPR